MKTYPKKTSSGSIDVTVGSGVNTNIPLGPVGVKPSNDTVTSVLAFTALLFLRLNVLLTVHDTLSLVTLLTWTISVKVNLIKTFLIHYHKIMSLFTTTLVKL